MQWQKVLEQSEEEEFHEEEEEEEGEKEEEEKNGEELKEVLSFPWQFHHPTFRQVNLTLFFSFFIQ